MSAYQAKFLKLRPEAAPGYIYLVQAVGTDKFKIGRATNVANRLRTIQTSSPLKIRYVYHAYVRNMNFYEMELHHKFSEQREIGEWFTLSKSDIEFCIFLMRLVQDAEPSIPQEDVEPEEFKPINSVVFCPEPEPELICSDEETFTSLNLTRNQAIELIKKMRSELNLNQKDIIEKLWACTKGGSNDWKKARAQFKELTGE